LYRSDQSSGSALLRHGQAFLSGANSDRDEAFGDRRIKAGGALECRATGVIEKLGPLLTLSAVESKPAESLGFIPVYSAVLPEVTKMYDLKKFGAVRSAEIDLHAITAERKIPHPAVEAITANGVP
jgi:hypothetical protein